MADTHTRHTVQRDDKGHAYQELYLTRGITLRVTRRPDYTMALTMWSIRPDGVEVCIPMRKGEFLKLAGTILLDEDYCFGLPFGIITTRSTGDLSFSRAGKLLGVQLGAAAQCDLKVFLQEMILWVFGPRDVA